MLDIRPFLRTIIDHPYEDGPRLVFADWLEEQGDPRGEFIRLQCQLANVIPQLPLVKAIGKTQKDRNLPETVVASFADEATAEADFAAPSYGTNTVYEVEHEDGRRTRPWQRREYGWNYPKSGNRGHWLVLHSLPNTTVNTKPVLPPAQIGRMYLCAYDLLGQHEYEWLGFGSWEHSLQGMLGASARAGYGEYDVFYRTASGPAYLRLGWRRGFVDEAMLNGELCGRYAVRLGGLLATTQPITRIDLPYSANTIKRKAKLSTTRWHQLVLERCQLAMDSLNNNNRRGNPSQWDRTEQIITAVHHGLIGTEQAIELLGLRPELNQSKG